MNIHPLLILLILVTLFNWAAAALEKRSWYITSKPAVLAILILWFALNGGHDRARLPYLIALIFSLMGDICLIPRSKCWFISGMVAFLIAHFFYIWAFNRESASTQAIYWGVASSFVILLITAQVILRQTRDKPEFRNMRYAFLGYGVALTVMLVSAALCLWRSGWPRNSAILATLGGAFFFASDTILGLDKMGRNLPRVRFWVILTYHIAQFLITAAALGLPS